MASTLQPLSRSSSFPLPASSFSQKPIQGKARLNKPLIYYHPSLAEGDDIKARNVSTSCSGSGMVKVAGVNAAAFNCTVSGSGMGRVSGSASKISLALRGSGMVDASGLAAQSVNVSCSGSGMVKFDKSAPNVKIVSGRQTSPGIVSR